MKLVKKILFSLLVPVIQLLFLITLSFTTTEPDYAQSGSENCCFFFYPGLALVSTQSKALLSRLPQLISIPCDSP